MVSIAENCKEKGIILSKEVLFSLIGNYLRPSNNSRQLIFNINTVVLIVLLYLPPLGSGDILFFPGRLSVCLSHIVSPL